MKKIWAIRKDAEAVSPVIATILMVAITVVLAAVLYVMVLGFGGGGGGSTPTATYMDDSVSGGRQVTILSIQASDPVPWDAVTIQLNTGTTFWNWEPTKAGLTGTPGTSQNCSSQTAGGLTIWCTVVDLGGDGYTSGSDYFVLTGPFVNGTEYGAYLLYEDNGQKIGVAATWTA